ncbi:MAG: NACHT domain-containing protein, partial [Chloroflexi bacterium]|nr:NACHT domain-containing protein [Chloroflexota bacterium]
MFKHRAQWLLLIIPIVMLGWVMLVAAQTTTPPPTPTVTPVPTEPPAILIITPTPEPTPPTTFLEEFWQKILAALVIAGSVLVGVFLKQIAETLAGWGSRFFHYLFDNIAGAPIVRLRYEKEYRATLAAAVQELQGGNLVEREIRLDQMYVPALLTEETRPDVPDFVDRFRTREEMRQQQRQRSVSPWQAVAQYQRFVVLGGPGAGKTTYLYHLAFMCAQRERLPQMLPIFIRFRELVRNLDAVERLEDVFPRVFADYKFPQADKFIEQQLKKGRFLILLDGLDEVPSAADHQRLIELVQDFADRHARRQDQGGKGNILVVSSRVYSYEHGTQLRSFPKTQVMEFDRSTVERFVHNWFSGDKKELAPELLKALSDNRRFLELARNPLLLLLIAYHYERDRSLPPLRAELYRECIHTRIARWNTIRGTHLGKFGTKQKTDMLGELALYIFEHEEQGLLYQADLLDWLETFVQNQRLPEGTKPEDLLEEIARTSGLVQEWAIDRYGFSHQTLQEYFAADALWQLGPEQGAQRLAAHFHNPA